MITTYANVCAIFDKYCNYFLVEHGALVNKCTEDQTSPLFIACQEGYESIVAILLKHGADFNMCRFSGMSPLYEQGSCSIISLKINISAILKQNFYNIIHAIVASFK
jgi:ankyrin repeat protein